MIFFNFIFTFGHIFNLKGNVTKILNSRGKSNRKVHYHMAKSNDKTHRKRMDNNCHIPDLVRYILFAYSVLNSHFYFTLLPKPSYSFLKSSFATPYTPSFPALINIFPHDIKHQSFPIIVFLKVDIQVNCRIIISLYLTKTQCPCRQNPF